MDKRKLAAALALGGSIAIVSLFGGSDEPVSGSYRGGYYAGAGSYRMGTPAATTFKLLVRDKDLPNTAAADSGWVEAYGYYDQVNEATANETMMRYGGISVGASGSPNFNVNGAPSGRYSSEDDASSLPLFMAFVAFNTAGLTPGDLVTKAKLIISSQRGASNNFLTGYFTVRLDTLAADYEMLDSVSFDTDASWLNTSYDDVNINGPTPWSPLLTARDDAHDFGPRGETVYPGVLYSFAADSTITYEVDVLDPIQQVMDNGKLAEQNYWVIFVFYQVGTPTSSVAWGIGDALSRQLEGNPMLIVETSSKRGPEPWGGGGLPFNVSFDDQKDEQVDYFDAMTDSGLAFTSMASGTGIFAGSAFDNLNTANPGAIYYVHHTLTHPSLGDLTGAALNAEMERDWFEDGAEFTVAPDTSLIVNYCWSGGSGTFNYGIEAIEKMVDYSFQTSRASTTRWTAHQGTGLTTYLSLDAPVNMYMYEANFGLFGTAGAAFTQAQIKEYITDHIDELYTDHGKAAFNAFTHDFAINGITEANLRYTIGLINQLNSVQHMSLEETLGRRDGPRIDPAAIAAMDFPVADSTAIKASAAMHDSLIGLTGHDQLLQMWIGPKGN